MAENFTPDKAFILAAGKGTRMMPLTADKPKPMIDYKGRPIIDHILDKLVEFGVSEFVINLHYLGDSIKSYLSDTRSDLDIYFSEEDELLDTGGGIAKTISRFNEPFFVVSGDGPWEDTEKRDGFKTVLSRLSEKWDGEKMDILMLLQPASSMTLTQGVGDYDLGPDGQAIRRRDQSGTYMFTSIRVLSPKIFNGAPQGPFSFLELMDKAEQEGRLYGLTHEGDWHHLSTPEDVARVNEYYAAKEVKSA